MKKILIPRLQSRFIELILDYKSRHKISQQEIAKIVGTPPSTISNLKTGDRILSASYILKFINKGIFRVDDIYDGKPESSREIEFWELARLAEIKPLSKKIAYARELGLDIEAFLDGYIYSVEKKRNPRPRTIY